MMKPAEQRNNQTVRLFVAINPGKNTLDAMNGPLSMFKQASWAGNIRWIPAENIHLTLKFIGPAHEDRIACLVDQLSRSVQNHGPLTLTLSQVMFLPTPAKARVMAVALDFSPELERLATAVDEAVGGCGFERERRRFKAHVTVGRCRELDAHRWTMPGDFSGITLRVRTLSLMQSTLLEHGAVYRCLRSFDLC